MFVKIINPWTELEYTTYLLVDKQCNVDLCSAVRSFILPQTLSIKLKDWLKINGTKSHKTLQTKIIVKLTLIRTENCLDNMQTFIIWMFNKQLYLCMCVLALVLAGPSTFIQYTVTGSLKYWSSMYEKLQWTVAWPVLKRNQIKVDCLSCWPNLNTDHEIHHFYHNWVAEQWNSCNSRERQTDLSTNSSISSA